MHRNTFIFAAALITVGGALGACQPASADACEADDECGPGERCRAGSCLLPGDAAGDDAGDSGGPGDVLPGDALAGDAAGNAGDEASTPTCSIGSDDAIASEDLPFYLDLALHYREASGAGQVPVDLVASEAPDGVDEWDLDLDLPGDHDVEVGASAIADWWFADDFPSDAFVTPIDGAGEILGIYQRQTAAILLVGIASSEPDVTAILYDPPVTLLALPATLGDSYATDAYGDGTFEGNPFYTSREIYEVAVDGRGRLLTPAGSFEVLRVRVNRELLLPMAIYPFWYTWLTQRQVVFVTPCFGQIALVRSLDDESAEDFTRAALVRRLSLVP